MWRSCLCTCYWALSNGQDVAVSIILHVCTAYGLCTLVSYAMFIPACYVTGFSGQVLPMQVEPEELS